MERGLGGGGGCVCVCGQKQAPQDLVQPAADANVVVMDDAAAAAGHGAAPQGGPVHVEAPAPVNAGQPEAAKTSP